MVVVGELESSVVVQSPESLLSASEEGSHRSLWIVAQTEMAAVDLAGSR